MIFRMPVRAAERVAVAEGQRLGGETWGQAPRLLREAPPRRSLLGRLSLSRRRSGGGAGATILALGDDSGSGAPARALVISTEPMSP